MKTRIAEVLINCKLDAIETIIAKAMSAKKTVQFLSVGLVLLFLFFSIFIGVIISYKKADSDDLKELKDSLLFRKEHLAFKHDLNELKETNALYFDEYHIALNQYSGNVLDLLTIANHTRHKCEAGEINGCWKKEIDVYKNDTVAVQMHYHNASPVTLDDVSFDISRLYTPNSIKIEIVVKVRGKITAKDIVKAYLHGCNRFNILKGWGDWTTDNNNNVKVINHINEVKVLVKDKSFQLGKLLSDDQGLVIIRFKAVVL